MHRAEREIEDRAEIADLLARAQVIRIAFCADKWPYIVPLNFGLAGNSIYAHTAPEGKKLGMLAENDRICFEVDLDVKIVRAEKACDFGCHFQSVIGFGRAFLLSDPEEKIVGLNAIMMHYTGKQYEFPPELVEKTAVIRVDIDSMTGKKAP